MTMGQEQFEHEILILPRLAVDIVLGMDVLRARGFQIQLTDSKISLAHDIIPTPVAQSVLTLQLCNAAGESMRRRDRVSMVQKNNRRSKNKAEDFPDFIIEKNRLFKNCWDALDFTDPEPRDPWKLCVPKTQRLEVLRENHDEVTAGHMMIAKTLARIAQRYDWPGMFRDVAKYVRGCRTCKKYKIPQQAPYGKMQPSSNTQPWATDYFPGPQPYPPTPRTPDITPFSPMSCSPRPHYFSPSLFPTVSECPPTPTIRSILNEVTMVTQSEIGDSPVILFLDATTSWERRPEARIQLLGRHVIATPPPGGILE
ncbi:hypothetical protein JTB14_009363 [Gonioctena quinquepunctata]|nr:hypothetical protein JTB14_009363 [Gonioctena quinquepunctata]